MGQSILLLRLEGPMQSWGVQESKFVVRRTADAPTKSGVFGLLCAAIGVSRPQARPWLERLASLQMGVRVDRSGMRWWDYHTVGAGMEMRIAEGEGKTKPGAMLTRREYLCDASFLVALQGESQLISELAGAVAAPKWALYLGRKACPMSCPPLEGVSDAPTVMAALASREYRKRHKDDALPQEIHCLVDWTSSAAGEMAPAEAQTWYDVPVSFEPPSHRPRLVMRHALTFGENGQLREGNARQAKTALPLRPRANYTNSAWTSERLVDVADPQTGNVTLEPLGARPRRLRKDGGLCVFCKAPATTVQHVTYRRAGGDETQDDLRSLCRLCHDAVTMIEYGQGMGLDRINPEDPQWRDGIIRKRDEIVEHRSLETRRRRLEPREVE